MKDYYKKYLKYKSKYLKKKINKNLIGGSSLTAVDNFSWNNLTPNDIDIGVSDYSQKVGGVAYHLMYILGHFLYEADNQVILIDSMHDKLLFPHEAETLGLPPMQEHDETKLIYKSVMENSESMRLIVSLKSDDDKPHIIADSDPDITDNFNFVESILSKMVTHIDAGPSGFKSLEKIDKQPWKPQDETSWVCGNSSLDTWINVNKFNTRTFGNIFDSASIGTFGPVCIETIATLRSLTHNQVLNEFYQCLIKFLCGNLNYHIDDTYKDTLNYLSSFTLRIGTNSNILITIPGNAACDFFVSKSISAKYINKLTGDKRAKEKSENSSSKGSEQMYQNIFKAVTDIEKGLQVFRILKYMGDKAHIVWTFYILYIDYLLRNNKIENCSKVDDDGKFEIYTTPKGNIRWLKNDHIITLLTNDRLLLKSLIDIINKIKRFDNITHASSNNRFNIPVFMNLLIECSNKICVFLSTHNGNLPLSCQDLFLYNSMKKNVQDIKAYNFILCYKPEDPLTSAILKLFDILKMIKKYKYDFDDNGMDSQQKLIAYFTAQNSMSQAYLLSLKTPYDFAIQQNEEFEETKRCSEFIEFCQDKLEINYKWNESGQKWEKKNPTIHYTVNKKNTQKKEMKRNNPTANVEVGHRRQAIRIGSDADYNDVDALFSKCPFELGFYEESNCLTRHHDCMAYDYNLSIYEDVIKNLRFFYTYLKNTYEEATNSGTLPIITKTFLLIQKVCSDYLRFVNAHHATFSDFNKSISGPYGLVKLLEKSSSSYRFFEQWVPDSRNINDIFSWKSFLQNDIADFLYTIYELCNDINQKLKPGSFTLNLAPEYIPDDIKQLQVSHNVREKNQILDNDITFIRTQLYSRSLLVASGGSLINSYNNYDIKNYKNIKNKKIIYGGSPFIEILQSLPYYNNKIQSFMIKILSLTQLKRDKFEHRSSSNKQERVMQVALSDGLKEVRRIISEVHDIETSQTFILNMFNHFKNQLSFINHDYSIISNIEKTIDTMLATLYLKILHNGDKSLGFKPFIKFDEIIENLNPNNSSPNYKIFLKFRKMYLYFFILSIITTRIVPHMPYFNETTNNLFESYFQEQLDKPLTRDSYPSFGRASFNTIVYDNCILELLLIFSNKIDELLNNILDTFDGLVFESIFENDQKFINFNTEFIKLLYPEISLKYFTFILNMTLIDSLSLIQSVYEKIKSIYSNFDSDFDSDFKQYIADYLLNKLINNQDNHDELENILNNHNGLLQKIERVYIGFTDEFKRYIEHEGYTSSIISSCRTAVESSSNQTLAQRYIPQEPIIYDTKTYENVTILFSDQKNYEQSRQPIIVNNQTIYVINNNATINVLNINGTTNSLDELHNVYGKLQVDQQHLDPFDKTYKFFKASIIMPEKYINDVSSRLGQGKLIKFYHPEDDEPYISLPNATKINIYPITSDSIMSSSSPHTRLVLKDHIILFSNEYFYEEYSRPFTIGNEQIGVVNKTGHITVINNDGVSLNNDQLHQNIGRIVANDSYKQYQDPFDKVYKFLKADIQLPEQYQYRVSNIAEGKLLEFFITLTQQQSLTLPTGTEIYIKEMSYGYDSQQYVEPSYMNTGLNRSVFSIASQQIQTPMYTPAVYQQCQSVKQKNYNYLHNQLIMYKTSIEDYLIKFPLTIKNSEHPEIYVVNESKNFYYLREQIGKTIDQSIHNSTRFIPAFNDTFRFLLAKRIQISDEFKLEVSTGTGKKIVMKFKNDETGYNGRAIPDGSIVELAF